MSQFMLVPVDRPGAAPKAISPRLRSQLVYFAIPSESGLPEFEYRFDADEVAKWLDDGVISLVSPLDTANMTDVELSEEQEAMLAWLSKEKIGHVRVEER